MSPDRSQGLSQGNTRCALRACCDGVVPCTVRSPESSPAASPSGSCWPSGSSRSRCSGASPASSPRCRTTRPSSWLPGNAESTRALAKLEPFQDPNAIPTTVVYEKKAGFSAADLATMRQQAAELQQMDDVTGRVLGPIPSARRPGGADRGHLRPRRQRLEQDARHRRGDPRHRRHRRHQGLHRRRRWPGRRLGGGVRGPRQHPAAGGPRSGRAAAPADLPQPGAVGPADLLRRRRAGHLARADLLPGQVRRPDRQRAEPGDRLDPGDRRRHRLRPAPGGPLPRRAPSPRRPARGDGLRAAPGHPGHRGQREHGDRRDAVPAARRDELHRGPGPGVRHRHRRGHARDDHPAAGAARDHRALDLLALPAHHGLDRADLDRAVGQGRRPDRTAAAPGVGRHRPGARGRRARGAHAEHQRALERGRLHRRSSTP